MATPLVELHLLDEGAAAPEPKAQLTAGLLVGLVLAAALAAAIAPLRPPVAAPVVAPPSDFAAERAARHLRVARERTGPEEAYRIDQLTALGLPFEVQVVRPRGGPEVRNILARLPGTASTGTILLVVQNDPLSSAITVDRGAGTATLLEALRALKASPPLLNDVLALFPDAEAPFAGLRAFREHPSARDVALILWLRTSGAGGVTGVLSVDPPGTRVGDETLRALSHPLVLVPLHGLARSIGAPPWRAADIRPGAAGVTFVSTPPLPGLSRPAAPGVALSSLQDDGDSAVALVRHFGDLPLTSLNTPGAVAFNAGRDLLVGYPARFSPWLLLMATVLLIVVIRVGVRSRRLSLRRVGLGAALYPLGLAASALLAALAGRVAARLLAGTPHLPSPRSGLAFVGLILLGAAAFLSLDSFLRKRLGSEGGDEGLASGSLFWWWVLGGLTLFAWPDLNPLFVWPLLVAELALLAVVLLPQGGRHPWPHALAASAGVVPAVLLFTPAVWFLGSIPRDGSLLVGWPVALALLLIAPLVSHRPLGSARWALPPLVALLGVALLVVGLKS